MKLKFDSNRCLCYRLQKSPNQHPNTPETQRLQAEIHALKQRLQETGARGDNELEQWRKVVEQEKNRADQAEKAATDMHKHVQVIHCSVLAIRDPQTKNIIF